MSSPTPPRDHFWGPLGGLGRHRADIFFVFGCRLCDRCADPRSDGQNVLHKRFPRLPETMKTKVSPTRKRCFHISTPTSKIIENDLQWVPFGVTFRSFWAPRWPKSCKNRSQRGRWAAKNSMSKKPWKKGHATQFESIRAGAKSWPWAPLKRNSKLTSSRPAGQQASDQQPAETSRTVTALETLHFVPVGTVADILHVV